jgi:hypothetical protein
MELFDIFGRRTSTQSTLKRASYVSDNDQFPVFVATADISKVLFKKIQKLYVQRTRQEKYVLRNIQAFSRNSFCRRGEGISITYCECAVISGSLSPRHGASSGFGWRHGLQYGG